MKTIKIDGVDFSYDEQTHYEKDGHIYCKECNRRIDGKVFKSSFISFVSKNSCLCDEERKKEEAEHQKRMNILNLKTECFKTIPKLKNISFSDSDPKSKEYEIAHKYVEKFELMTKENIGLLFYGNVGSGKTYLAAAIANAIIEEYEIRVRFRNIPQIINEIEKGGFNLDKNEYINSFSRTPLLILDDFGIERKTEYSLELLYQIINARYESGLPTIISTNISVSELTDQNKDIQLQRIYSRVMEMCTPVGITGRDNRLEKNRRKTEIAGRELLGGEYE